MEPNQITIEAAVSTLEVAELAAFLIKKWYGLDVVEFSRSDLELLKDNLTLYLENINLK